MQPGPFVGDVGQVKGKSPDGHYEIIFEHAVRAAWRSVGETRWLFGCWHLEAAARGDLPTFPIVNL